MGIKETQAVNKLIADSHGRLKLYKVENTIASAMPDLIGENRKGTAFWIEGKHIDDWPKRATTCPLRSHFEPGQQAWHRSWESWNGHALVFLRVGIGRGASFYIFRHNGDDMEKMTKAQLLDICVAASITDIIEYLEEL